MKAPWEVPVSFAAEHGPEPHCFVCNKPIEIGDLIEIRRLETVLVWRHQACIPEDDR